MECVHTPELRYGEFSEKLHKKAADKRIPISGSLELTFRCNLRCQHCYAAHGHQGIPGKQELTYEEIQNIFDEIVDAGCLWFLITGGEPLMRRDFLDIYKSAKGKGLIVTLFTNGTMLTPHIADYLAEWRPFAIEISLYGSTQATYEHVTGIPGSFSRCIRGIELLLERDLPLRLKAMLMTINKHELVEMQAYAKSLDVEFRFDPIVDPGLENSLAPLPLRLSPEEVVQIERSDTERATLWSQQFTKVTKKPDNPRFLYSCGAGRSSFHIDPYGKMSLCISERMPGYNLRKGSFQQGWDTAIPSHLRLEFSEGNICAECDLREVCPICPALARREHGDPQVCVDYFCQITHLRAETFSIKDGIII